MTEKQIRDGCKVLRKRLDALITEKVGAWATSYIDDADIREGVIDVLKAAEKVKPK